METQKKIAIIDKNVSLNALAGLVELLGYAKCEMYVHGGTTNEEIVEFIRGQSPDAVLLAENFLSISDVMELLKVTVDIGDKARTVKDSKRGEGVEALVEIKKQYPELPVLMVSTEPKHMDRAMKAGANGYYTSRDYQELGTLLNSLTSRHQS